MDDPDRTRSAEDRVARLVPSRWATLTVLHGGSRGERLTLTRELPVVIGRRGEGVELAIDDERASRRHARVAHDGGTWSVEDLGSKNGTFVDGQRVGRVVLASGSIIRAGDALLTFEEVEVTGELVTRPPTPGLPGPSIALSRVRGELELVARQAVHVLVTGPSGSGKELVAAELHRLSGRAGAFVAVNCAAIPEALAERELFGHVAGAYTGATGASAGLVAAAARGTLCLDEIGELPLPMQAKLLRTLARGEVRAVGASETQRIDVRVVCATHRDLRAEVEAGRFRGDLYARISGWVIEVPPLAQRREDILPLAQLFLERAGHSGAIEVDAAEMLLCHGWPYNVRELEQVVLAARIRAGVGPIGAAHLPRALDAALGPRALAEDGPARPAEPPLELVIPRDRAPTLPELQRLLAHFGGRVSDVAAWYGKDRKQVYRWAERLGLDPDRFRPEP